MKHKDPSLSEPGPSRPRAQVWAPVLVLLLVPAVVWASFYSGPGPVGPLGRPGELGDLGRLRHRVRPERRRTRTRRPFR